MAQQLIDVVGNIGESFRSAYTKVNDNFTELYNRFQETGYKFPFRAVTTAALPAYTVSADGLVLTGSTFAAIPQATVDGIAPFAGMNILVASEPQTPSDLRMNNGLYTLTQNGNGSSLPFILTRHPDASAGRMMQGGMVVGVRSGTRHKYSFWMLTIDTSTPTIGTTPLVWSKVSSAGSQGLQTFRMGTDGAVVDTPSLTRNIGFDGPLFEVLVGLLTPSSSGNVVVELRHVTQASGYATPGTLLGTATLTAPSTRSVVVPVSAQMAKLDHVSYDATSLGTGATGLWATFRGRAD